MTAGATSDSVSAVADRLSEIAGRVGRPDLVARIRAAMAALGDDQVTVVVAGEAQRGKSTLINALLDSPGLLPAGSEHPTNVPIAVVHGVPGHVVAHFRDRPPQNVAPNDLAAYVCGATADTEGGECMEVVVQSDHPLLEAGLRLVDTPGVGGLDAGHAKLTLAALARAEALLFVLDSTAPLTRSELEFVLSAAQRTVVIFVVARIDSTLGWREILEHDRRLIAESAPSLAAARWFAVSAVMKGIADLRSGPSSDSIATRALADSGVPDLVHALRKEVVDESSAMRVSDLGQICRGVIDALAEPEMATLAALEGTRDDGALDAERATLLELLGKSARWRTELDVEMRRLSIDVETESEFAFTELTRRFEQMIGNERRLSNERVAADLDHEIAAMWIDVDRFVQDRIVTIVDRIVEQIGFAGGAGAVGHLVMPQRVRDVICAWRQTETHKAGGAETLLQYYPVIFSGGLVATLSTYMTNLFAVTANPMQIALGGLATMGATFTARRTAIRRSSNRQEALQIVRAALSQARSSLSKQISRQMVDSRAAVESGMATELENRRALLSKRQAEQRDIPKDPASRQKAEARARQRLGNLDQFRQRLEELENSPANREPSLTSDSPNKTTDHVAVIEEGY